MSGFITCLVIYTLLCVVGAELAILHAAFDLGWWKKVEGPLEQILGAILLMFLGPIWFPFVFIYVLLKTVNNLIVAILPQDSPPNLEQTFQRADMVCKEVNQLLEKIKV